MIRIALVVVPFFLSARHRRLAEETLASIRSSHEIDTIGIVNGLRSPEDLEWLRSTLNYVEINDINILSRAWNKGIRKGFERGARYVIVSNLDSIFHPLCIDNLAACAEKEANAIVWSASRWNTPATFPHVKLESTLRSDIDWSCYMVDQRLFEVVGEFDEGFRPAYLEDEDMCRRMVLKGVRGVRSRAAYFLHQEAGTIRGLFECPQADIASSAAVLKHLRACITANDERYLRKWGGRYGTEKFTVPFDGKPE